MKVALIIVACLVLIGIGVYCTIWVINKKGWFGRKKAELNQTAGDLARQGASSVTEAVQDVARKIQ